MICSIRVRGLSPSHMAVGLACLLPRAINLSAACHRATIVALANVAGGTRPQLYRDSLFATSLATITADTGAFMAGWRDFSHYEGVGECLVAAREKYARERRTLTADIRLDTLVGVRDTIGIGATIPIARACATRFPLATVPERDWSKLFEVAIYARDPSLVRAVLSQQLKHARPRTADNHVHGSPDSTWLYTHALTSLLHLGWRVEAESLVNEVNIRFPQNLDLRVRLAHGMLLDAQQYHADTAALHAASDRILQLTHLPQPYLPKQYYFAELGAWSVRYTLPAVWLHGDSMLAVAALEQKSISRLRFTDSLVLGLQSTPGEINHWQDFPNYTPATVLTVEGGPQKWLTWRLRGGGMPAPRLRADYWFPAPGAPKDDTIRPVVGKVNLICNGGELGDNHFMPMPQHRLAAYIRRWLKRYGADRLAVTLVFPASGFSNIRLGNGDYTTFFATRAQEAEALRWYVQTYEQLPVAVAIQARTDQWLPAPDGRRSTQTRMQFNTFWASDPERGERHPDAAGRMVTDYSSADSVFGNRKGEVPGGCVIVGRDGDIKNDIDEGIAAIRGAVTLEMTPGASPLLSPPGGWVPGWGIPKHYLDDRINPYRLPPGQYVPPRSQPIKPATFKE